MTPIWTRLLVLMLLNAVLLLACSHTPKPSHQAQELSELQEQLRVAIVNKLASRPDLKAPPEVKILDSSEKNGQVRVIYQVTYLSESPASGVVSSSTEGEVHLVKVGERSWDVAQVRPRKQEIEFQEPEEIVVKTKKKSTNP
ncbi:MAG: hypothetical protein AB7G93_05555 [Bdellovibrionales bacterium]